MKITKLKDWNLFIDCMTLYRFFLSCVCPFQAIKNGFNMLKGLLHIILVWMYSIS